MSTFAARAGAWLIVVIALALFFGSVPSHAFCGFYVGKADAGLFNEASQVIMVRRDNRTVISMANDYKGELTDFALVVPVPTVLERSQIRIGDRKLFERIDSYSAPRLAEYFDPDPCRLPRSDAANGQIAAPAARKAAALESVRDKVLGVTVEASYTVGEYDIVILSGKQSDGLETWLRENGYRVPKGEAAALKPYIRQQMKFFVAKVNLEEQARTGVAHLRPLQFAFESERFMLPVRLGMLNANGPQDLVLYVLTAGGRVETTNYRTVKLPSGMELPASTKERFAPFYRAMFDHMVRLEDMRAVFLEYAWDMGWCDPCAADPLSDDELRTLGVFWLDPGSARFSRPPNVGPAYARPAGPRDVFVTRLHLRYDGAHFPEDLVFQQTGNRENFQGRYVLRHDWSGGDTCPAAEQYRRSLPDRHERQAQTLASLTGWKIEDIRKQAGLPAAAEEVAWWRRIWK